LFNWQEAVRDMISAPDLDRELAATEGKVKGAVDQGLLTPDHTLALGQRTYHYFSRERIEEIRTLLGLPKVTPDTIKRLFLDFVEEMDMAASYKPVLLLAFLDSANSRGRARMSDVVSRFTDFYKARAEAGDPVEVPKVRMSRVKDLTCAEIHGIIVSMPLRKFQQRRYLDHARDLAWIQFNPDLWRQLTTADLERVCALCQTSIERYYARLTKS
jgi:hypothetical protein